jgi:wyosine [tRNA(Phe)-imidazoG37] synthetase (radical SAM superfamily)
LPLPPASVAARGRATDTGHEDGEQRITRDDTDETEWPTSQRAGAARRRNAVPLRSSPEAAGAPRFRFDQHSRQFDRHRYVYAVLSRRARGISIGINLSPDKVCNFDCVYCQVDRRAPGSDVGVDEARLLDELATMLDIAARGDLEALARREHVPAPLRRIADVAFAGDGEPTCYPGWGGLVRPVAELIESRLPGTPLTLLTNASLLHRPRVQEGLAELREGGGRIWAKLDAGNEADFRLVAASGVPFARVLANLREAGRRGPLTIQTLLFRRPHADAPSVSVSAIADRLAALCAQGAELEVVQLTTVARRPPTSDVVALTPEQLDRAAAQVRQALDVPVEVYPGAMPAPERDTSRDEGRRDHSVRQEEGDAHQRDPLGGEPGRDPQ